MEPKWLFVPWAKTIDNSDRGFPLVSHSLDVAEIIVPAALHFLGQEYLDGLSERQGASAESILKLAGIAHDCGKMSPFFQLKQPDLFSPLNSFGFTVPRYGYHASETHHSDISGFALTEWLDSKCDSPRDFSNREAWFFIMTGHHGRFHGDLNESDVLINEPAEWRQARHQLLDWLMVQVGITDQEITRICRSCWEVDDLVIVSAILIVADWLGSNAYYFPYDLDEERSREGRLERALERIDLGGKWAPDPDPVENFADRFNVPSGAQLRTVQKAVVEVAQAMDEPTFLLLENETGGGKTAAALVAADIIAEKFGLSGLYFAQPTMMNSNAMFSQIVRWLKSSVVETEHPVSAVLVHGKAAFNEEFDALKRPSFYGVFDDEHDKKSGQVQATTWFAGPKRGLLGSAVVGTIDQLLFASLNSKHVVLRHLGLLNKVVIIDEIHASDTFMQTYLVATLEWLGFYGVPVIALSATVSRDLRTMLLSAYKRGASRFEMDSLSSQEKEAIGAPGVYPRLSSVNSEQAFVHPVSADDRSSTITIEYCPGDAATVANQIIEESVLGGCVISICSTVSRAQELYAEVLQLASGETDKVVLLHSRFLALHRAEREQALVDLLGRDTSQRPKRLIVVSTQIVEQGLDLDFDLMFTDIAPVDLILQRAGRLHRHPIPSELRPVNMSKPRLVITGIERGNEEVPPRFPRGIEAVYRRYRLLRTALVLDRHVERSGGVIRSPKDVPTLIDGAYDRADEDLDLPNSWLAEWEKAKCDEEDFKRSQKSRSRITVLPSAEEGSVMSWGTKAMTAAEEVSAGAQVRDIDESIEVVVVRRINGRVFPLIQAGEDVAGIAIDGEVELDPAIARRVAQCTIRLPGYLITDDDLCQLESEGRFGAWHYSPWLKGQLPLILDENLSVNLERTRLIYEERRGLVMSDPPGRS
ncbi:CRISPR-associated helicase Cas3' [Corynebacterium breve]|uniref:CRISPR-associated helicase Cas3 n=1 Tax=Corynebacterium breve TaxID=3049799 RepID=A0ABY8VHH5_9CORY|nr:CRISPR-associated helicase Cas3' [Corynebacterium breve]WIM67713.1 CRISPR-associated helicase Cas3' [Corynebacterium breve]